jgi:hypothetical protein
MQIPYSRREMLAASSNGFGLLALAGLLSDAKAADNATPGASRCPRAKHVILCFMDGGPSHVDTFDYKPELMKQQGKPIGDSQVSKLSQSRASLVWKSVEVFSTRSKRAVGQ